MEETHSTDNHTDDILIETNENSADTNQKGVKKRVAQTPPDTDAKKPKLSSDSTPDPAVIDLSDESPQKDEPQTPRTPRTPKISKEEREKLKREKLEEKERQKVERDRILEEKRLEREKLAEEKRLEKDKKEKERLEKKAEEERKKEALKEEKRKEAEEKKKKEEEEKQKKEEEKLKKEEEKNRKKKEEEEKKEAKRREEEEKKEAKRREEEAIEEKKRRESAHFVKFFSKVEKKKAPEPQSTVSSWYLPFPPKDGMSLAPILPRAPLPADFDIWKQHDEIISIATFLNAASKMVAEKPIKNKPKQFQFHENRRPPYYGTWRKKSLKITASCPLAEEDGIDYEVDSDDEWEEEPSDCEECNSDDDDDDNDGEDDGDNDGFFVPPCYLSDGEGEEDTTSDGEIDGIKKEKKPKRVTIDSDDEAEDQGHSSDERKARMAKRAVNWEEGTEKKKKVVMVLKPRAVGPVFHRGADQPADFKYMTVVKFY